MDKISAVVINYNGKEYLEKCLDELVKHRELDEIIVVDDASTDGSVEYVRDRYPSAKFVVNPKNSGPVYSRQAGSERTKSEYILFVDCDIVIQKNTALELRNFLEKNKDFWLAGANLFHKDGKSTPWKFGYAPNIFKNFFYSLLRIGLYSNKEIVEVGWVRESCFIVKKDILTELGGFDLNFFMFHEGPDLSLRAKKIGYKTALIHEAKVLDLDQKSRTSNERFEFFWKYNRYFYKKHYSLLSYIGISTYVYLYLLFRKLGFKNKTHYE